MTNDTRISKVEITGIDRHADGLETLAPVERAVFVLREVFDTPYSEARRWARVAEPCAGGTRSRHSPTPS